MDNRRVTLNLTGSILVGSQGNIFSLNESVFSLKLVKKNECSFSALKERKGRCNHAYSLDNTMLLFTNAVVER